MRLALALAFTLALAAPAVAQDSYTPIVGSGSFNAAPILQPGRYRDTVLPEEYLYYAVELKPGQALHVTANSELDTDAWSDLNVAFVKVNVAAPDRFELSSAIDGEQSFTSADAISTPTRTGRNTCRSVMTMNTPPHSSFGNLLALGVKRTA